MHTQRSVSWIDRRGFASLLERAGVSLQAEEDSAPPSAPPLMRALSVPDKVETPATHLPGSAAPAAAAALAPETAVVEDPLQVAPGMESPPSAAAVSAPDFIPPDSTQERRFEVLLHWLGSRFDIASCFVADADGLPLRARDCDADIIAIGSTLLSTWRAISRDSSFGDSGVLCVETGTGSWLFLMLSEGRWGRFCLGVGTRKLLEMEQVDTLRRAFRAAVEEE